MQKTSQHISFVSGTFPQSLRDTPHIAYNDYHCRKPRGREVFFCIRYENSKRQVGDIVSAFVP